MLKVRLKEEPDYSDKVKKFIALGEPVPQIGQIYTVTEYVHLDDLSNHPQLIERGLTEYHGYVLEEFDWSELGILLVFHKDKFDIVGENFIPNCYMSEEFFEGPVESIKFHMNLKYKL